MQSEFDGLKKIRSALSFLVVSQVLLEAGAFLLLLFVLFASTEGARYPLLGLVVILIGFVLYVLSIAKFRSGFKLLRNFYRHLGIGYLGANLIIIGYVLILLMIFYDVHMATSFTSKTYTVSTLNLQPVFPLSFYLANVLVALIPDLGNILTMLGIYRIGNIYDEINVRVGGLLVIVGFILSIAEIFIEMYGHFIASNIMLPITITAVSLFAINSILFFIGASFVYQGLGKILRK